MRRPWKIIVGFALLGLAIAGVCYAYAATYDYTKPMNGRDVTAILVSLIFCPPQLLFAWCIDCEVIGRDGLIQYAIIGFFNAALYAAIGAIFVGLKRGPSSA